MAKKARLWRFRALMSFLQNLTFGRFDHPARGPL
jgi:hypothetical protein